MVGTGSSDLWERTIPLLFAVVVEVFFMALYVP